MVHFVVCGQSSSFVGSCLCFLSGQGGGVVVGGCWHLWMVMKGSSGDKHGWWWWEEKSGHTKLQAMFFVHHKQIKVAMFGGHDCQTNIVCYPSQINKWIPAHSRKHHSRDHSGVNSGTIKFHQNENTPK